jgi:hypothetical protein
MPGGPSFIDRQVFEDIMAEIPRQDGEPYQDVKTVYGDMSRLVVAWLASKSPEELAELYNQLGWKGKARTTLQMQKAAKLWMEKHRSNSE